MKLARLLLALAGGGARLHYGQWAEDVLVRRLLPRDRPGRYLDVGAYHPFRHSNTAALWLRGWNGVNVDAHPQTVRLFRRWRPRDRNVWAAVVPSASLPPGDTPTVTLHLPPLRRRKRHGVSPVGTCDPATARARGFGTDGQVEVPATTLGALVATHAPAGVDFLNIDIEGLDAGVLADMDWTAFRPGVISIEDYAADAAAALASPVGRRLGDSGYALVARAGPTSIFQRV